MNIDQLREEILEKTKESPMIYTYLKDALEILLLGNKVLVFLGRKAPRTIINQSDLFYSSSFVFRNERQIKHSNCATFITTMI